MKLKKYLTEIFDSNIEIKKLNYSDSRLLSSVPGKNKCLYEFEVNNKVYHFMSYEVSSLEKSLLDFDVENLSLYSCMFLPVIDGIEDFNGSVSGNYTSGIYSGFILSAVKKCLLEIINKYHMDGFLFSTNNPGLISLYDRVLVKTAGSYGYKFSKKFDHDMMGQDFKARIVTKNEM